MCSIALFFCINVVFRFVLFIAKSKLTDLALPDIEILGVFLLSFSCASLFFFFLTTRKMQHS